MTTLVIILMILVCFNFVLKQTFTTLYIHGAITLFLALFAALVWPIAIEQSSTQISDWLHNVNIMRNVAVVLSLDVMAQLAFCFFEVNEKQKAKTIRQKILHSILKIYPGFIILPVILSILVQIIYILPGVSFQLIAAILAIFIIIVMPIARKIIIYFLPEKELRLEILFLLNIIMAMAGVLTTVNVQTNKTPIGGIDINASILCVIVVVAGVTAGWIWGQYKTHKKITSSKNINKK